MIILYICATIVMVLGTIFSFRYIHKQQHQAYDKSVKSLTIKKQIFANPLILAYLLIPITFVVLMLYQFFK